MYDISSHDIVSQFFCFSNKIRSLFVVWINESLGETTFKKSSSSNFCIIAGPIYGSNHCHSFTQDISHISSHDIAIATRGIFGFQSLSKE